MKQLKVIWNDNGKHNSTSVTVSVRAFSDCCVFYVDSPTDIIGAGSNYGEALEDFIKGFDEYIDDLIRFRDEILNTKRAYTEAIEVDWRGKPLDKE